MSISKSCLEKSSMEIFQLLARIPYNSYISENTTKYGISDSKEDTYPDVPLQQIWML